MDPVWDRKQFKLEVMANDNTTNNPGGRTEQLFWYGNSNMAWNNSAYQKVVTLNSIVPPPVPPKPHLTIYKTAPPPNIDGDASDWSNSWINMTQAATSNTTVGMTAKFQCKYDTSNLYFIFNIFDNTPGDTSVKVYTWERDCVDIFLSMDTTSSGPANQLTGFYHLRRIYGWDGSTGLPGGNSGMSDGTTWGKGVKLGDWNANPKFKVKEVIDGNNYIQEWQIPWDSLQVRMDPAWDAKQLKLEVQATDNSTDSIGGVTERLMWYGNSLNAWNNSTYQGVVTLDPAAPPKPHLTIKKTAIAPTIDGDASDWSASWMPMLQATTFSTTSNMTAKFQCKYDNDNLYFIFNVIDNTPGDTSSTIPSYEKDCVEVMMSMDTMSSYGITGMFQFRRVYGWDGALGRTGGDNGITDGTLYGNGPAIPASWNGNPNFKVKEIIDGNSYTQEWQLPWDSLQVRMNTPWDRKQFKLEVMASDNTTNFPGGRTQQLYWYSNSNQAWNNSAYQEVVTLETSIPLPNPTNDALTIYKTSTPPTIDGNNNDWNSTWINMTQAPINNSTSNMTAKFQCKYDDDNLYFIFNVNDATPGDTPFLASSYERDCIEVMMSMDTISSSGITGMYQFRRVYGWNGALGHTGGDNGITDGTLFGNGPAIPASWNGNPNFKVKEFIDGISYTQEWQIPWDSLMVRMTPAWDKKQFKLEVAASDNTTNAPGGRTQQLFWHGNSNMAWNNSAYQGVVTLNNAVIIDPGNSHIGIKQLPDDRLLRINVIYDNLRLSRTVHELSVFTITGQLVIKVGNTSNVNIGTLKKGFYVARTEGKSYKFIR
jgi:hypothetical protein